MGSADSKAQVTPSRPLRNHLLSRVNDPRSPTTGIPRTPIEVGESPRNTPQTVKEEEEEIPDSPEIFDPRSPTNGITRTPLRPPIHAVLNNLAKQLSEVFVAEDSSTEGGPLGFTGPEATNLERQVVESQTAPPAGEHVNDQEVEPSVEKAETQIDLKVCPGVEKVKSPIAEMLETLNDQEESPIAETLETMNDQEESPIAETMNDQEESPIAEMLENLNDQAESPIAEMLDTLNDQEPVAVAQSVVSTESTQATGQQQKTRGKSPRSSGVKNVRQRPRKALLSSSSGRSPLRILQEDNSPNTNTQHRQAKKLSFQSEPALPHRALKISHPNWESSLNKENAEYGHSNS
ncbi:cell division cycle-associated protein 3 isoform X1 [Xenopus laevis]|uniref:Cell division cycle-associated protein 3 isoform X1 n=1 Tax=Xenopus laevis TaxID=8355 RepID=A0A8J1LBT0_XENLA|nr:cell division cycle-associated protein 3 isoform X1 [Xenopus laevis]